MREFLLDLFLPETDRIVLIRRYSSAAYRTRS